MGQRKQSDRHEIRAAALGDLLKAEREAAGLSLTQMAMKLGISQPYLSRLERGEYAHPSPEILLRIAECLKIRAEDLYALTGLVHPTDLPNFVPYLRAKHPDWPDMVITELDDFCDFLKHKYFLR
jgi:transcriptional regulator with XRE-family HTH domain